MAKPNFPEQLKSYLNDQTSEQLIEWLSDMVIADKDLKKQWQIKLLLASGKPNDFKKMITQALPKKELLVTPNLWHKVGKYFEAAEDLFDLAFDQIDQDNCPFTNEQQFNWLVQAFERINYVIEAIDDSGGYRLVLVDKLSTRLIERFHKLDWSLDQKASWLHEHRFKNDVFPYIPEEFQLSEELLNSFNRLAGDQDRSQMPSNVSMTLLDKLSNAKDSK